MSDEIRHITARTCPLDPETGEFQSTVAEAAFKEAVRHGFTDRKAFQQILQAHNAAEDKSRYEYEKWKEEREAKARAEMKQLDDMTEPELGQLTTAILNGIKAKLPPETGFCVLYFPWGRTGISQYGSNCQRSDMIKALREAANRIERRQDVPRA